MGVITDKANEVYRDYETDQVYRDYETDQVPSSGIHHPIKSDVRELMGTIDNALRSFLGPALLFTTPH